MDQDARNADGRADLVVGSLGSHTLSVRLGKGEGTFSEAIVIPVGRFPHYRVYADFNGDGHLDAALVSGGEDLVQILLGDGTGRLTLTHSYRVGTNPHGLAGSDFNGDGHLDLVLGNRTSLDAVVLLGDGKGKGGGGGRLRHREGLKRNHAGTEGRRDREGTPDRRRDGAVR